MKNLQALLAGRPQDWVSEDLKLAWDFPVHDRGLVHERVEAAEEFVDRIHRAHAVHMVRIRANSRRSAAGRTLHSGV